MFTDARFLFFSSRPRTVWRGPRKCVFSRAPISNFSIIRFPIFTLAFYISRSKIYTYPAINRCVAIFKLPVGTFILPVSALPRFFPLLRPKSQTTNKTKSPKSGTFCIPASSCPCAKLQLETAHK